jgi:DNA-binding transcriptional MerR regulator
VKHGYKIATISRLTGFSPMLLRAWESRHQLLTPSRGPGGQRLYSDSDVLLLRGVRALLDQGLSIGEIVAGGRAQILAAAQQSVQAEAGALSEMELSAQALARLSARMDPDQILSLIVDTLATDFQAALARIWVHEPAENVLVLRASAGLSRRTTTSPRARIDLRRYRYKVGVVGRSGEPFVSNAVVGDQDFDQRWVLRERLLSVAIVPLTADEDLQGVMALFFRMALSQQAVSALNLFATVAASSIAAHREPSGADQLCA